MIDSNGFSIPPGPRWPVLAQTIYWVFRPVPMMHRLHRRFGDTFSVRLLALGRIVMTSDPAAIRGVFTAKAEQLHAGEANIVLAPIVGDNSVLVLDEGRHLHQRRLLLPPFHGERLRAYLDEIEEIAELAIDGWPRGETISVRDEAQKITLDVILRVVFGITDPQRTIEFRERMNAIDLNRWFKRFALMPVVGRVPWLARRIFADFFTSKAAFDALMVEEIGLRRDVPDADRREDILSLLLQARDDEGRPMSDAELIDELVTLVVAGHETTATALAWCFELMLRHPDVWRRVREEATGGGDEYVDAVIKESLRMRPILPLIARVVKEPFEIPGYRLPPGSAIAPNIFLAHHREASYPHPGEFRPERFLGETPEGSVWLPFGGGMRRCIGASFALFEMRVVIQAVARRVDVRLTRDEAEPIARRAITFTPKFDVPVRIENVAPRAAREPAGATA